MLHTVLIALGAIVVHLGAQVGMQKFGWLTPLGKKIEQNAPGIEQDIKQGAELVEHTPQWAALKVELAHKESQLRDTRVGVIAGKVLQAIGKKVSDLTPDDITKATALIKAEANKEFGIDLPAAQVTAFINDIKQGSVTIAASDLFKAYEQFEEAKQAVAQASTPAAPATAPVTDGQPVAPAVS